MKLWRVVDSKNNDIYWFKNRVDLDLFISRVNELEQTWLSNLGERPFDFDLRACPWVTIEEIETKKLKKTMTGIEALIHWIGWED